MEKRFDDITSIKNGAYNKCQRENHETMCKVYAFSDKPFSDKEQSVVQRILRLSDHLVKRKQ